MNTDTFMREFGHLIDAPGGIEKLRGMVLELAIQGKLVPQDADDESVSLLMQRVIEEKKRLILEGQLRKSQDAAPVSSEEQPFEIPASWTWTRVQNAGVVNPRNDTDDELKVSFTPMKLISSQYGTPPQFESRKWGEVKSAFTHFAEGDVVVAKITPCFQNRKSAVMRGLRNGIGAGTTELHVFRPLGDALLPEYVLTFFKSRRFVEDGVSKMTGSAGQKRVPKDYFAKSPLPVPPLAEQKRIVAKVDELMALCDALEDQQRRRRAVHVQLNDAALDRLTSAESDTEFQTAWTRVHTHFDQLYSTPKNITALRQTILQLAVQGKLVPQDPNDESATNSIERLNEQRKEMLERKEVRKLKVTRAIESVPFEVPNGWTWARFGDVIIDMRYGTSKKCGRETIGTPVFRIPNIVAGKTERTDLKYAVLTEREQNDLRLRPDDLLIIRSNGSESLVGRTAIVGLDADRYAFAGYLVRVRSIPGEMHTPYLQLISDTDLVRGQIEGPIRTTSGVKNINSAEIANLLVPIAPIAEQERITKKVRQMMTLCDTLEAKLTQQQTDADQLTEAMVAAILDGAAA